MARPTLFKNRKFLRLVHGLGRRKALALGHLELLWVSTYESGEPVVGDAWEVEEHAGWEGEPGELVRLLMTAGGPGRPGFIEVDRIVEGEEIYRVHDFWEHCPDYVRKRWKREQERKQKALMIESEDLVQRNSEVSDRSVTGQGPVSDQGMTGQKRGTDRSVTSQRPDGDQSLTRTPAPSPAPSPAPLKEEEEPIGSSCPASASGTAEPHHASPPPPGPDPASDLDPPPEPILEFPCRRPEATWLLTASHVAEWQEVYPEMDILAESRKARAWLHENPGVRLKTHGGMKRFVGGWLRRSNNSGSFETRSSVGSKAPSSFVTRHQFALETLQTRFDENLISSETYDRARESIEASKTEAELDQALSLMRNSE